MYMFDDIASNDLSLTKEEIAEVKPIAKERLRLWLKRLGYSGMTFFLSCSAVVPFLYGHSLHAHWESFGKYLVLLSMGLLIPFVICAGTTFSAWILLRDLKKTDS
jgi:hypothetical protein